MKTLIELGMLLVCWEILSAQSLAETHALIGQNRLAEALNMVEQMPSSDDARFVKSQVLIKLSREDEALDELRALLKNNPNHADYQYYCGLAYLGKLQRTENFMEKGVLASRAKDCLEKAVQLDSKHVQAKISLAGYYASAPTMAGGNMNKAFVLADEIMPYDARAALGLQAGLYIAKKEYDRAVTTYAEMLKLVKLAEQADVYVEIGQVYVMASQYVNALESYERALTIDQSNIKAKYQIGRLARISNSNLDKGIVMMKAYISSGPHANYFTQDVAWWRIGNLYEQTGDKQQAEHAYKQALALNPENDNARKSLDQLKKK